MRCPASPTRGALAFKRRRAVRANLILAIGVGLAASATMTSLKEVTMLESTRPSQPVEKPSRLQLAITEWQRQLVEKAR
jgi:hypothetical protein